MNYALRFKQVEFWNLDTIKFKVSTKTNNQQNKVWTSFTRSRVSMSEHDLNKVIQHYIEI